MPGTNQVNQRKSVKCEIEKLKLKLSGHIDSETKSLNCRDIQVICTFSLLFVVFVHLLLQVLSSDWLRICKRLRKICFDVETWKFNAIIPG